MQTQTSRNMLDPLLGPTLESILLELEEKFPALTPHPKEDIQSIMFKAGHRSVVEWYRDRLYV